MHSALRVLVVTALVVVSASVRAEIREHHLVGRVFGVNGANKELLKTYGVKNGARVDVILQVNLATPATAVSGAPDNLTSYSGAVTWIEIHIGTWLAIKLGSPPGSPANNLIGVADDSGADASVDLLSLFAHGNDNDNVLAGAPPPNGLVTLSMQFVDIKGYAGSDQSLAQDPRRYPIGTGSAIGPGGGVYFSFSSTTVGAATPVNPAAKCVTAQLSAAAKMCQSQLNCESKYAKAPQRDPMQTKLDLCMDKAGLAFSKAFDKAAATAARKGLTCGTSATALEMGTNITENVEDVVADANAVTPAHAPLVSSWLSAAGTACSTGLKAEASNTAKLNLAKLATARGRASDKLATAAEKAVAGAVKKHVIFAPPPDVPGFVDTVNALIDDATSDLNGD